MNNKLLENKENLLIYKNQEGNIIVDAILKNDTLWLTQKGMSKVFDCSIDNISLHLKNIFRDNELDENLVTEKSSITASDGKNYQTKIYNLDAIISVGYRINSKKATEFRIWATKILKEYMGLTNWKNSPNGLIYKYDVAIAKNYLNEEEIRKLNDLTNMFLVFAEDEAKERHVMTMQDWIDATDNLLKFRRKNVLDNAGSISHKEALEKANKEYEKFRVKQDTEYISSMDQMLDKYLSENK